MKNRHDSQNTSGLGHFATRAEIRSRRHGRETGVVDGGKATWAITCLLLAWIAAIFAFGGTAGEQGGHYARVVMVGFTMTAVMLVIRGSRGNQR